jgi:hypothetical protein
MVRTTTGSINTAIGGVAAQVFIRYTAAAVPSYGYRMALSSITVRDSVIKAMGKRETHLFLQCPKVVGEGAC